MAIDYSGLKRFQTKLEKLSIPQLSNDLANSIAEEGSRIAKEQYAGTAVFVQAVEASNGEASVVATGDQINYMEFGTGIVGKGTYQGELPTRDFTFESPKGSPQVTHGWEYNYPNAKTKRNDGWFYNGEFTQGHIAEMQMFNTAKLLKEKLHSIIVEAMKKLKGKK